MPAASTVAELRGSRELAEVKLAQQPIRLPTVARAASHAEVVLGVRSAARQRDDVVEMHLPGGQRPEAQVACAPVAFNDAATADSRDARAQLQGAAACPGPISALLLTVQHGAPFLHRQPVPVVAPFLSRPLGVPIVPRPLQCPELRQQRLAILEMVATMTLSLLVGVLGSISGPARRATVSTLSLALRELLRWLAHLTGPTETETARRVSAHARLVRRAGAGGLLEMQGALVGGVAWIAARTPSGAFVSSLWKRVNREAHAALFARLRIGRNRSAHRQKYNRYIGGRIMIRMVA